MPKCVLKRINQVCRAFLWEGKISSKPPHVAWDWVCRPKKNGGLGVKIAMIGIMQLLANMCGKLLRKRIMLFV